MLTGEHTREGTMRSCSPPTVSQIPASVFRVIPYSCLGRAFGGEGNLAGLNGLNVGLPLITAGVPMTIRAGVGESWRNGKGSERCGGGNGRGEEDWLRVVCPIWSHTPTHSSSFGEMRQRAFAL